MKAIDAKSMLVLAALNVAIWLPVLSTGGFIIQRDFNLPLTDSAFAGQYTSVWNPVLSKTNIEQIPRLVIMSPLIALSYLGVGVQHLLKLYLLITYVFLSFSMYLFLEAAFSRLNATARNTQKYSMLGALVFAYNPVSLQFSGETSLLFSLGALPLLLYVSLTEKGIARFAIGGAILLLLSMGHPFTLLINLAVWLLFTTAASGMGANAVRRNIASFALTAVIFALVASWAFLPYLSNPVSSTALGREKNLDRSTFDLVSDNSPYKIISLERDKFIYVNTLPKEMYASMIHNISLVAVVVLAFSSYIVAKGKSAKKLILFFSGGYLASTLLSLGSKTAAGEIYWSFINSSAFGWTLRSPLKFQLYQSFFISALFIIGLALLLGRKSVKMEALGFSGAAILLLGVSAYGIVDANTRSMNPIGLPQEFFEINSILRGIPDSSKVLWYPRYDEKPTYWSKGHIIAPFDAKSSGKQTFDIYRGYGNVKQALYDVPYPAGLLDSTGFYRFLSTVDVRYIAFHNDRKNPVDEKNLNYLLNHTTLLYAKNGWYLLKLEEPPSGLFSIKSAVIGAENNRDIYGLAYPNIAVLNRSQITGNYLEGMALPVPPDAGALEAAKNILENSSFESWTGGLPDGWAQKGSKISISQSADAYTGNYSLLAETSIIKPNEWNFISSEPLDVESGKAYAISTHLKYSNANGTHVKIEGYNESMGKWSLLAFAPRGRSGTSSGWETHSGTVEIPQGTSKIRVVIGIGWMAGNQPGIVNADDIGIYSVEELLRAGTNRSAARIVEYSKSGPAGYTVKVDANSPFVLAFAESYDPLWVAHIDEINGLSIKSDSIRPVLLNSVINGFYINQTGNLEITIGYEPQRLFYSGTAISLATLIACATYLVRGRRNPKNPGSGWMPAHADHKPIPPSPGHPDLFATEMHARTPVQGRAHADKVSGKIRDFFRRME